MLRWAASWFALLLPLLLLGCGDSSGVGTTYPVSGTITFNGEPLNAENTSVLFKPDASKGNASPFEPVATVDADGSYTLITQGKDGAPPGWYKVVVTAFNGAPKHPAGPKQDKQKGARSLLPSKYGLAQSTPLAVEVVANPGRGAYDLKLTR
jgi:hypothetical protein